MPPNGVHAVSVWVCCAKAGVHDANELIASRARRIRGFMVFSFSWVC